MDFGDLYSIIFSRKIKWRIVLPVTNLAFAACMLAVGHQQGYIIPSEYRVTESGGEWTPDQVVLPPATQVAYAINFPALLISSPLYQANGTIVLGRAVFFVGIVALWFAVGFTIDFGLPRPRRKRNGIALLSIVGAVGSVLGIFFAGRAVGVHYVVPPFGALLWSAALGLYCVGILRNAGYSRR